MQAGPGRDALRSVVMALCDDLMRIKDRLDPFVSGEHPPREPLETLLPPLRHVADTLAVLGFQQPRRVIIDQVLALQAQVENDGAVDEALLMDVAGALLYVEATLNGMVGPLEETSPGNLPGSDLAEIRQLVLSESLNVLQQAKDLIGDCLESDWSRQRLQALPGLLQQVRGALAMLMLPAAAEVFGGCAGYVQGWLGHVEDEPLPDELAHLADALCAGEAWLQWRVADPLADAQRFIDMALASLTALGVQCPRLERPLADARTADGIDDELREVFLEEAGELLPEIERQWLRWRADNGLRDSLIEVRRALHTLKGSGRMVHAEAVAELAWGAEHLLNRVLEGRITLSAEGLVALQQVFVRLPDLLAGLDRASGADTPGQQQCFAVRAMGVEQPMGLAQVHRQAPTLTGAQFRPGKPAQVQAPGQLRPARLSMLQLETHAALRAGRQPHHPPLQPQCAAIQRRGQAIIQRLLRRPAGPTATQHEPAQRPDPRAQTGQGQQQQRNQPPDRRQNGQKAQAQQPEHQGQHPCAHEIELQKRSRPLRLSRLAGKTC